VGAQYHDQRSVGDELQIKTRAAVIDIEGPSRILPDIPADPELAAAAPAATRGHAGSSIRPALGNGG